MAEAAALARPNRLATRPVLVLSLVALLAWLPGFFMLPPLDRDESRFAQASHQMLQTRNYIDIRFASGPRYNKPVGIYWLQATAAAICGPALASRIWVYRLPSLIGGYLSLLLLYRLAKRLAPPPTAMLSALLLGTALLTVAESDIATTDAALLAAIVAAQGALMRVYLAKRDEENAPPLLELAAGWGAIGVGILLKGPVIVAVVGVTALALGVWERSVTWLAGMRPLLGAAIVLALVGPWAIAIGVASHGMFYQQSIGHDFASKLIGGAESHGAPPGYYLVLANLTFWPGILLLLPALGSAIVRRSEPAFRFLLCWSGAVWLMFELVPTKLPHYVLPAYPALALLCALWARERGEERLWQRILRFVACGQFLAAALALSAACVLLPVRFGGGLQWQSVVGALAVLVAACIAVLSILRRHAGAASAIAIACAVLCYVVLAFAVVPQLHGLWLSPRAAELVAANRRAGDPPLTLEGYVEPSMVFLLGGNIKIDSGRPTAPFAAGDRGLALVEARARPRFLARAAEVGATAKPLGGLSGLDYSTGREQHLTLYRLAPTKQK